jgi:hypothetical protein
MDILLELICKFIYVYYVFKGEHLGIFSWKLTSENSGTLWFFELWFAPSRIYFWIFWQILLNSVGLNVSRAWIWAKPAGGQCLKVNMDWLWAEPNAGQGLMVDRAWMRARPNGLGLKVDRAWLWAGPDGG